MSPRRLHRRAALLSASLIAAATMACTGADGPAGPAGSDGGGTDLLTAAGTASLILDESSLGYAQIPGLSNIVTVPAGGSKALLVETDGGVQINSADPTAVCATDVALFIDGTQVGPGRRTLVVNTPSVVYAIGSYGFSVSTGVAEGTHTISIRAKPFTPLVGVSCYVSSSATGSDLPGRPRLQGVMNVLVMP